MDQKSATRGQLEVAKGMLDKLLGPALDEGQLIGNEFKYYRAMRAMTLLQRAHRQLEEAGLSPQCVPPKLLIPILEEGALEDDDNMLERWPRCWPMLASPRPKNGGSAKLCPDPQGDVGGSSLACGLRLRATPDESPIFRDPVVEDRICIGPVARLQPGS